jgi:serine/threonine-protein kinase
MADIYLARVKGPAGFVRHVIVMSMRSRGDSALAMFLDEARLLASLHHQNIAQVYDLVVTEEEECFLAMEYVHGHTIQNTLRMAEINEVRIPLDFALTVVEATAMALHHAHERRDDSGRPLGIVHRDVTPANIMSTFDGAVKLIDFGIATAFERSTETQSGVIKGKTRYMAPEQVLGGAMDRRTDVFGLGAVLYELTTQSRAFPIATPSEIFNREVVAPSVVRPGYYPALEDVVMTAMARDAGYRFPDADAVARAVRAAGVQLGLNLGPGAIVRTMQRLYDQRDEPWMAQLADETPDDEWTDDPGPADVPRARRHPVSWGVVPATGALAEWEAAAETKDSTVKFLSIELEQPEAPGTFAIGSWTSPRIAARAELVPGEPADLLLEIEEMSASEAAAFAPGVHSETTEVERDSSVWNTARRPRSRQPVVEAGGTDEAAVLPVELELPSMSRTRTLILPQPRYMRIGALSFAALVGVAIIGAWVAGPEYRASRPDASVAPAIVPHPMAPAEVPISRPAPAATTPPPPTDPTTAPPSTSTQPPPRPASPPPPALAVAPRSAKIHVRVTADPEDATVVLDGRRLGHAPIAIQRRRESRTVKVKVRRRGYVPRTFEVSFDSDVVLEVQLQRRAGSR